jgi:hypothetical protein
MRLSRWVPKATETHSEYVIPLAFSLRLWLQERASMSRYTYIACLVYLCNVAVVFYCELETGFLTCHLHEWKASEV